MSQGLNVNDWVSFCHPIRIVRCWLAAKDMERDVITVCKYTKEEVYEGRQEECKDNVGTVIGRSQPEVCLDIRKKIISFRKKVTLRQTLHKNNKGKKKLSSFLTWNFISWYQAWYNAVTCDRRGQSWEGPSTPAKTYIHRQADIDTGLLYAARWASKE